MKTIQKTILTTFAAFLFTTTLVVAQPRPENHPRDLPDADQVGKMVEHLAIDLSLTPEQKTEIKSLYLDHFNEIKKDQQKEKEKIDLIRDKHEKQRTDFFESVKAELNEEQIVKFDELNKKHKHKEQREGNEQPRK